MSSLLEIEKAAQRNIKSAEPYLHLFPKPDLKEEIVNKDANVKDTVRLMRDVVFKYMDDTKRIAPLLKGKSLEETCRNVWDFWYRHVQYKFDKGEQLRRPSRTIYEQMGDCDCFSIAVCQTLLNLGIDCNFSVAKYYDENGVKGNWQHVYVTVSKPAGGYYTLDCVAHSFNTEQSFADKFNFHMATLNGIPVTVLSGFENNHNDELFNILSGVAFDVADILLGTGQASAEEQALDAIYKHLVSTRNYIQQNPQSVITTGGAAAHLQMLNHAIDNWYTPNRDKALELLEQEEQRWNEHSGANSLGNLEDEINGLGAHKSAKKFWGKVKETVKKVKQEVKKDVKKAGEAIKKAGKSILKYNPLSLAVRGGFLLAMKINLLNMSKHLYPAYLTEAEAKSKGINSERWNKAKKALDKIEKMFVDKLQGQGDKLRSAIVTGRAKQHFAGFGALGEPATITAVIASAAPIIAAAKSINSEGAADAKEGKLPEDKEALIQKIKDWWKKTFGKEKAVAPESISDADKEPNYKADGDSNDTGADDKSTSDKNADEKSKNRNASPDEQSGWMKFKQFISDNPGTVTVGVLAAGTVVTLLIVQHNKNKNKTAAQPKQLQQQETRQLPMPQTMSGAKKSRKKNNPNVLL